MARPSNDHHVHSDGYYSHKTPREEARWRTLTLQRLEQAKDGDD